MFSVFSLGTETFSNCSSRIGAGELRSSIGVGARMLDVVIDSCVTLSLSVTVFCSLFSLFSSSTFIFSGKNYLVIRATTFW